MYINIISKDHIIYYILVVKDKKNDVTARCCINKAMFDVLKDFINVYDNTKVVSKA